MSSALIAALSVVISLVAIVVVIGIFKYVRQFTAQLQQFGNTLNDIQSRMNAPGASSTSTIAAAPAQPAASRAPTVSGTPRIYIQKQGHPKTRPIDPRTPNPGMSGMAPPPTVVAKSEPESEKFINFDCSECRQNIDAPINMAGTQIKCPTCNKPLTIPSSQRKPAPKAPAAPGHAENVFQEKIVDAARKDVTIRIDLSATPELQEPDEASITVKRHDIKVRRA